MALLYYTRLSQSSSPLKTLYKSYYKAVRRGQLFQGALGSSCRAPAHPQAGVQSLSLAAHRRFLLFYIIARIDRHAVDTNFEVQPFFPGRADRVAFVYLLPDCDERLVKHRAA